MMCVWGGSVLLGLKDRVLRPCGMMCVWGDLVLLGLKDRVSVA